MAQRAQSSEGNVNYILGDGTKLSVAVGITFTIFFVKFYEGLAKLYRYTELHLR